jgi:hypothetical protein
MSSNAEGKPARVRALAMVMLMPVLAFVFAIMAVQSSHHHGTTVSADGTNGTLWVGSN